MYVHVQSWCVYLLARLLRWATVTPKANVFVCMLPCVSVHMRDLIGCDSCAESSNSQSHLWLSECWMCTCMFSTQIVVSEDCSCLIAVLFEPAAIYTAIFGSLYTLVCQAFPSWNHTDTWLWTNCRTQLALCKFSHCAIPSTSLAFRLCRLCTYTGEHDHMVIA